MRRLFLACAALGLASSAVMVGPAQAAPYHIIRWSGGSCSVWDEFFPAPGWPTNYSIISGKLPTWEVALDTKARLVQQQLCAPE
jgi:hypothetical protein